MNSRTLLGLIRPWSLPMSAVVVLLGGAAAYRLEASVNVWALSVAALGALLLQAGTNALNDVNDVALGIDRPGVATAVYRHHPILAGEVSRLEAVFIAASFIASGIALGFYVSLMSGPLVLVLEVAGVALLLSYNGPLINLKAVGLGEVEVATVFGPLLLMGGFVAASGRLAPGAALVSVMPFFLMLAIIYSNFYRDRKSDAMAGIRSLAILTQSHGPEAYTLMLAVAYLAQVAGVVLGLLPLTSLITLLTLPYALKLPGAFRREALDIDARTGKLFVAYNVLLALGLVL